MINTRDILISKKGMKELKKQISHIEHELKEQQASLRELDKSDSREERLARIEKLSRIELLETELNDKKQILARVKLLPRKRDTIRVALGSVVDLIDARGRLVRYTIVDTIEANPSDGRISIKSPLGQRLIGRQLHDIVEWTAGLHTNRLRLVGIA